MTSPACHPVSVWRLLGFVLLAGLVNGCGTPRIDPPPQTVGPAAEATGGPVAISSTPAKSHLLVVAERWLLNLPLGQPFDASGLLRRKDGTLFTVNDNSAGSYRIDRHTNGTADLVRDPAWFTPAQLKSLSPGKIGRWDLEGLAEDSAGRIYFCEELNRWVVRADPQTGRLERMTMDWSPVQKWFSKDLNASWEGIAVGTDGFLYLANERSVGRIVVVDLASLRVVDDFQVTPLGRPARDVMYSDLCWYEGELWVLCRQSRRVLRVEPATHRVLADFDYTAIELSPEHGYLTTLPYGQFEGLAVDAANIWLIIDNNGTGRALKRDDIRPALFRCSRPDR